MLDAQDLPGSRALGLCFFKRGLAAALDEPFAAHP
jgi:hypothetical protein